MPSCKSAVLVLYLWVSHAETQLKYDRGNEHDNRPIFQSPGKTVAGITWGSCSVLFTDWL